MGQVLLPLVEGIVHRRRTPPRCPELADGPHYSGRRCLGKDAEAGVDLLVRSNIAFNCVFVFCCAVCLLPQSIFSPSFELLHQFFGSQEAEESAHSAGDGASNQFRDCEDITKRPPQKVSEVMHHLLGAHPRKNFNTTVSCFEVVSQAGVFFIAPHTVPLNINELQPVNAAKTAESLQQDPATRDTACQSVLRRSPVPPKLWICKATQEYNDRLDTQRAMMGDRDGNGNGNDGDSKRVCTFEDERNLPNYEPDGAWGAHVCVCLPCSGGS